MKIIKITEEQITFDNGCYLTYEHEQNCCEHNYADFSQLEDTGIENEEFTFSENIFELCEHGFRLVANSGNKYFIPCFSYQNGYYSTNLDIIFNCKNSKYIIYIACEWVEKW